METTSEMGHQQEAEDVPDRETLSRLGVDGLCALDQKDCRARRIGITHTPKGTGRNVENKGFNSILGKSFQKSELCQTRGCSTLQGRELSLKVFKEKREVLGQGYFYFCFLKIYFREREQR